MVDLITVGVTLLANRVFGSSLDLVGEQLKTWLQNGFPRIEPLAKL